MTNQKTKNTLEEITKSLGQKYDEDRLHAAMLLSYAHSVYSVLSRDCVPAPLYRVNYDSRNNNIEVEETKGHSLVPKKGALDIDAMDVIFISNLRDIPILFEGDTGVGKTYVSQKYLTAVFGKEQYFSHRLSANAFVNNLFQHFQEGRIENGMPVINAKTDAIENTGAGIVDEINRGDSNETLQLFDNEMHLSGVIYKLGLPIPQMENRKYSAKGGRTKNLLIITAQNPSFADDAKFTQTLQLDAAVDNRLLKTIFGNAAPSAGSTLWLGSSTPKLHDRFIQTIQSKLPEYYGRNVSSIPEIGENWLSVYAWITDSERTDKPILYSSMELADFMVATFTGNMVGYYDYERKILSDWNSRLKKGVTISDKLKETETVKAIDSVTQAFKVPIIFRDIAQIKKLSDVLATLRNIKDSLASDSPVDTYLNADRYVTVREVAGATALLALNKQRQSDEPGIRAVDVVNEVLNSYVSLVQEYTQDTGLVSGSSFQLDDPNAGIKYIAVYKAMRDVLQKNPSKRTVPYLISKISEQAKNLTEKISASEDLKNLLIARSAADLMTLCGFLSDYGAEIEPILKSFDKKTLPNDAINSLGQFYYRKLEGSAAVIPAIYQHRIQRTLGV